MKIIPTVVKNNKIDRRITKSGIKLDSLEKKKLLENILSDFGIMRAKYPIFADRKSNEITNYDNECDFRARLYKLIKAMLFITYQFGL